MKDINLDAETVNCLGWTSNSELFSLSDDKKVLKWSSEGEPQGQVSTFEPSKGTNEAIVYPVDMHWFCQDLVQEWYAEICSGSKWLPCVFCCLVS